MNTYLDFPQSETANSAQVHRPRFQSERDNAHQREVHSASFDTASVERVLHRAAVDLCAFPEEVRTHVLASVTPVALETGAYLFRQGDSADSLYFLAEGRLAIAIQNGEGDEQVINELGPGATVGEIALLTGQPRSATVYALEPTQLFRLSRDDFAQIAAKYPDATRQFALACTPRLRRAQLEAVLTELFGPLSSSTLHNLERSVHWQHLERGATLFQQGESGDALYVVISGRLRFTHVDADGKVQTRGEIGRGETVGELALITGEPRSATVRAIRDSLLIRLSQATFDALQTQEPATTNKITRHVVQSLLQTIRTPTQAAPPMTNIVLVPSSPGIELPRFATALATSLNALDPTLHLNSKRFDYIFGREADWQVTDRPLIDLIERSWLSEQERHYRYILYECDSTWTPWTQRALLQADRILLVGSSTDDPTLSAVERQVTELPTLPRVDLVLISPEQGGTPAATARWLAQREVDRHYHIRGDDQADLDRLARHITGNAFGLVLGGGSAHGLAHIGVLRAFEEAGMPIDAIGGVSMGALIGAAYLQGMDCQEMANLANAFSSRRTWFDLTLPFLSILSSRKVTQLIQSIFGERYIEDLPRPYFCLSSDLTAGKQVVHRTGPLWHAIRASSALPVVFTPVPTAEGNLLIDGAAHNNLPVDIMQTVCAGGPIAAADVVAGGTIAEKYNFGPSFSGWQALLNPFLPRSRRVRAPGMVQIVARTTVAASLHHGRENGKMADLYIRPDVDEFTIFAFDRYEALIERGYRAAKAAIATWDRGTHGESRP